jgi:hypothetical protein
MANFSKHLNVFTKYAYSAKIFSDVTRHLINNLEKYVLVWLQDGTQFAYNLADLQQLISKQHFI